MSKRTKKDKRPVAKIDFKPYGAAIKAGRTKQKESRNKAADALFISPRYLANIENKGQHPSVQVFLELMSRYHISVDQILHGEAMEGKSTERMQFETLLDELTDAEIKILTATAQALLDARAWRVFITDLRYEHSIFCIVFVDFFVMYGAGFMPALLFYADLVINSTATPFRASAL